MPVTVSFPNDAWCSQSAARPKTAPSISDFVNGSGPQVTGTTSTLSFPVDGAACAAAASRAAAATAANALSGAT